MDIPKEFTHLSPIPYPVTSVYEDYITLPVGPFSASECVEFFWRVRKVSLYASLNLSVIDTENNSVIWDVSKYAMLDSEFDSGDSAFAVPPHARCAKTHPCMMSKDGATLQISGPFLDAEYPVETPIVQRGFFYDMYLQFGAGSLELSTRYIDSTASNSSVTVERYPFDILGKTFFLNLNMPRMYMNPADHGLNVSYDSEVQFGFEFYD